MTGTLRSASRVFAIVCSLLGGTMSRSAKADEASSRQLVIVLRPNREFADTWPEGTQAVVAELVAGGYELTLRSSSAHDRDELLSELARAASEQPVLGAIVVVREGERGIAYVYTEKSGTVPIETGLSEGAVGEGAVALRITQLLGPPHFDLPALRPAPAPAPAPAPRTDAPAEPGPAEPAKRPAFLVSLGAGLAFTSDLPEPLPFAGFGARGRLLGPLSLDAGAAFSLGASRLETSAGSVDVSAQHFSAHLAFEPFTDRHLAISLGLGGGVVLTQGSGKANDGFVASDDSAIVALLSARAAAIFTHNDWSVLLAVEPGVLLPAVNVGTGAEPARLGRPWTMASVGLGRSF